MQLPSRFLPYGSPFCFIDWKKAMFGTRLSVLAVCFWVVLATPTIAAAPKPDVRRIMNDYLVELKAQYSANEKHYVEEQKRIHDLAEKARKTLCEDGDLSHCKDAIKVNVTSYNPVSGQTDDSPCAGAGGDVCASFARGEKPIALSQDLIKTLGGGPFKMGDSVEMQGGNCTGTFTVLDTMNQRFDHRADIFSPKQSKNVGCEGVLLVRR